MSLLRKLFKKQNSGENFERESPPPYDDDGNYNPDGKKRSSVISKQDLDNITKTVSQERNQKIFNEIDKIIKESISNDKIIRYVINIAVVNENEDIKSKGFYITSRRVNVKFFSSDLYDRDYCEAKFIQINVANESVLQCLSDYLLSTYLKGYVVDPDVLENMYEELTTEVISSDDIACYTKSAIKLLFSYESINRYSDLELMNLYNKIFKFDLVVKNFKDQLVQSANNESRTFIYESSLAEFYYEYFRFHKTFGDINLSVKSNKLIFSW